MHLVAPRSQAPAWERAASEALPRPRGSASCPILSLNALRFAGRACGTVRSQAGAWERGKGGPGNEVKAEPGNEAKVVA